MSKTMKAAFVTEFGKPLTIDKLPAPEPPFMPGHEGRARGRGRQDQRQSTVG